MTKRQEKQGRASYEGDDPVGFVKALNLRRRDLTRDQRRDLVVKLKEIYEKEARKKEAGRRRGEESCKTAVVQVNCKIAEDLRVSERTVAYDLKAAGVSRPTKLKEKKPVALGDKPRFPCTLSDYLIRTGLNPEDLSVSGLIQHLGLDKTLIIR